MSKRNRRSSSSRSGRRRVRSSSHSGAKAGRVVTPMSLPPDKRVRFEHLMRQADAFRLQQDLRRAKRCYEGVLALLPDFVPAIAMLSQCYARLREIEKGIELAKLGVELVLYDAHVHANLADILLMSGLTAGAGKEAERAVEIDDRQVLARIILAKIADQERDYESSVHHLRRALQEASGDPNIIISLAQAYRFDKQGEEACRLLERLLERSDIPPAIRTGALSEMGMIYDQLKRSDEAYEMFAEYGRLTAESVPAGEWSKDLQFNIIKQYGPLYNAHPDIMKRFNKMGDILRKVDHEAGRPTLAFLVGFPRSGTTMTELIFDAHRDVVGVEEPPYFHDTKKKWRETACQSDDVDIMFGELNEERIIELRRYFWSCVDADLGVDALRGTRVFLYKHPLLINELALINALFPEAKVIVALRDPRDCCLSCFMQDFGINAGMIHFLNLEDTCRFYAATFGLYLTARKVLTLDRMEIRYEDIVSNFEENARRLIEFLGLEWDPAVLEFHQRARGKFIPTPSFAAVNEPVNTRAVARWKRYEKYFRPYIPQLLPYLKEFGYDDDAASAS